MSLTWTSIHYRIGGRLSRINTMLMRREFKFLGRSVIWWNVRVNNPSHISIGDGTAVRSGSWLSAVLSDYAGNTFSPSIAIGNCVYLGHRLNLTAVDSVTIEDEAMIADGVYISDNFHDFRDITRPIQYQRVYSKGPLVIKAGAFVGEGARIVGPVTIGRNSAVGSNSVVTRNIPDFSVAAGMPTRVIRRYDEEACTWERVKGPISEGYAG